MTDHGRAPAFGANLDPVVDFPASVAMVEAADRAGLDFIGVQDHPYNRHFLDTWTLIAAVVGHTERIHFVTDVASLPLRPPAMLAKAAASLDVISGGRIDLGLGAGSFWDGIAAMGGPRRSPGEAVDALSEAIDVMRLLWSDERSVRYDGEHYSLHGVHPGPSPAHRIELWLGAIGPRMLRLTGAKADGWIPSLPYVEPAQATRKNAVIDEAAERAGRSPGEIRRAYNVMGIIGESGKGLSGPVEAWVETLTSFVRDVGMDTFLFWPTGGDPIRQVEMFAHEVAPEVKREVDAARK